MRIILAALVALAFALPATPSVAFNSKREKEARREQMKRMWVPPHREFMQRKGPNLMDRQWQYLKQRQRRNIPDPTLRNIPDPTRRNPRGN